MDALIQQRVAAPRSMRAADRRALLLFSLLVVVAILSAVLLLLDRPIVLFSHGPAGVRYHGGVMALSWRSRDYSRSPAFLTDPAGQPQYESLIELRRWDNALPRHRWEHFGVRYARDFLIREDRPSDWVADEVRRISLRFEYVALLLTAFCLMAYIPVGRARHRARRVARGLCPTCGYDLRASFHRCPECGQIAP